MISRAEVGLLIPPQDKVSAIGATLRAHWTMATAAAAKAQFWTKTQNWLNVPRHYLNRITTSR